MIITTGAQLGPYTVISPLGSGGMGEVWRAKDARLNREVAIKLLPASFATDADRLSRFKQEALATSSLNHPNIMTIYDIGSLNGAPYIVAELLEGDELRDQLNEGALPVGRCVEYAQQITQGLAAAHEKGVVHRDLKPENLFVTKDGRVKILDFGLAKLRPSQVSGADSQAPTQKKITDPGTIMGTVGYMSPEQVRGQETDHRADIFSFGVILFEMLSGRRAFAGESAIEVMNAILKEEAPELGETNAKISPALDKVVRRCLEKKPERRFQTASDLGFALEALSTSSGSRLETAMALPVRKRERLAWLVAGVAMLLGMLGFATAYFTRQSAKDARVFKTSILPPEKASFGQIAVSPDGRQLAFTAATGGKLQLWLRALDSTEAKPLAGTQGARFPFWSPDSHFIGFFADGRLKKIEITGGLVQPLCDVPASFGGSWSHDGIILFGQVGRLYRISETGGAVTKVTTPDRSRQEVVYIYPTFLPDGRHFFYGIMSGQKETRGLYLGSLDGAVKRRLFDDITLSKYMAAVPGDTASAGWLVFGRGGALLAQPFDAGRLDFTGEPIKISDKAGSDPIYPNYYTFTVSDNGVLVFDQSLNRQRRQYRWVDRRGQTINSLDVVAGLGSFCLSHDEKRFVTARFDPQVPTSDLWLYDVSGSNPERFTIHQAADLSPVWSPNGRDIVWASTRDGAVANLYKKAANLDGVDTLLLNSEYDKAPTDWSRDGLFIVYNQTDPKTKVDVWVLPVARRVEGKPSPVLHSEAWEMSGTLSRDGRWLAYASNESGQFEVWVQNFPGGGGKRQVSNGGGNHPRWRRDGRELFYYSADGYLMAAQAPRGENFEKEATIPLFDFRAPNFLIGYSPYAVTADGQRFLIDAVLDIEPSAPLTVVVNWAAEVKK